MDTAQPGVYVVTYDVSDGSGNNATQTTRTVTVEDTVPPALALIGGASVTLECPANYIEEGATADDACEGDLAGRIQIEGSVDDRTPGVYTLTYSVVDGEGNAAAPVTRTVTVVDTVAPSLALRGNATVTIECGTTYRDDGATAEDACNGTLDGDIVLGGSVDSTTPGAYTLTYDVSDSAGNAAARISRTVVVEDTTPPEIALNGDAQVEVVRGQSYIELDATATDACAGDLTADIAVDGSAVDVNTVGDYTVTYDAVDSANNSAVQETRLVRVVTGDRPVITLRGAALVVVECTASFSDEGAAASDTEDGDLAGDIVVGGDIVNTGALGVYILTYDVSDSSGNRADQVTREIRVEDNTPPVITILGANPATLIAGGLYIDEGAMALDVCRGDVTAFIQRENSVDITTPGEYQVTYTATDAVGNSIEAVRTVIVEEDTATEDPCRAACRNERDVDGDGLTDCQECRIGTNSELQDTDGDGMLDNFEVRFGLDPFNDDTAGDLDADGLTNIEEYMAGSDPRDPDSPVTTFFVGPGGSDSGAAGGLGAPWTTIAFALTQATATEANPVRINLLPGLYFENIVLAPWVTLASTLDGQVTIVGSVIGANNSRILDIEITASGAKQSGEALLFMDDVVMEVSGVTFRGAGARTETGILVDGAAPGGSVVEGCTFTSLSNGIDIGGALPLIRRCTFEVLSQNGIIVRATATVGEDTSLGDARDTASGYNFFDLETIDGFAVVNEREDDLIMENNYWGTQDNAEIAASISGGSDFIPFHAQSSAILAGAIFVTVRNAETQKSVLDATVSLDPTDFDPVTDNIDGLYTYQSVDENTYIITAETLSFAPVSKTVTVGAGEQKIVTLIVGVSSKAPGASCYAAPSAAGRGGAPGDLLLAGLLFAALGLCSARQGRPAKRS